MSAIARFCRDERGASAIEYGLIAGIISCVIIQALMNVGSRMNPKFRAISNALS